MRRKKWKVSTESNKSENEDSNHFNFVSAIFFLYSYALNIRN